MGKKKYVIEGSVTARRCTACGGTKGWRTVTENGRTTTRHSCGAAQ